MTRPSRSSPPRYRAAVAGLIEHYLMEKFGMRKPPESAARLLALILELHAHGQPFPQRRLAAEAIGASVFGVDAALSVALARGLITTRLETIEGNVQQRLSVIRLKYYIPAPELLALARRATAPAAHAPARGQMRLKHVA